MTRAGRRFCSEPCRKKAERARRPKRIVINRATDKRATFDTARYVGGPLADQDLGTYYRTLRRDPCVYCSEPAEELDHIEPKAQGGHNYWDNRAAICSLCNARKGKRSLLNALVTLPLYRDRARLLDDLDKVGSW